VAQVALRGLDFVQPARPLGLGCPSFVLELAFVNGIAEKPASFDPQRKIKFDAIATIAS
jgi:hypothetical protein